MIFFDFEASGIDGFPIEIGFAVVDADRSIRSASRIIRHDEWLEQSELWDWRAETIHGITRANVMEFGEDVCSVAAWLNAELAGDAIVSDQPIDHRWMSELFAAAGIVPQFGMALLTDVLDGPEVDPERKRFAATVASQRAPRKHRAAADAVHLAELYLAAIRPDAPIFRFGWNGNVLERLQLA